MSQPQRPPDVIDTQRLSLRRPTLSDAAAIFESYAADPEVTRFLLWTPHESVDVTRRFIARCEHAWFERTAYRWVLETRTDRQLLGMLSLCWGEHAAQIGSVLARNAWGQGYVAEALEPIVDWALAQASLFRVWAVCDVDDPRSARVLEKLGMQREGYLRKWQLSPNVSPVPRDCYCYARVKSSGVSANPRTELPEP